MRYSKGHKGCTRDRIVASAARCFTARGFEATSIEDIMKGCGLTRGGFYAHFKSKSELYAEAMSYAAAMHLKRVGEKRRLDRTQQLDSLLNRCLELPGGKATPLAFLSTDACAEQPEVRSAYSHALKLLSDEVERASGTDSVAGASTILSITALIVGALTIARATDEVSLRSQLLESCQESARALLSLEAQQKHDNFFWTPPWIEFRRADAAARRMQQDAQVSENV